MSQICIERCAEDGLTCETEMDLDMCTCKGHTLSTLEAVQFDMERYQKPILDRTSKFRIFPFKPTSSGQELVVRTPFSSPRFVRTCGDCREYCEW